MSETYLIKVMVVDKNTRKGVSGYVVKEYQGAEVKTDNNGIANLVCTTPSVFITVNGAKVYEGYAYNAPATIVYEVG